MSTSKQNIGLGIRLLHLKVKLISIGAECAVIHREERRAKARARWCRKNPDKATASALEQEVSAFWSLRSHRMNLKFNQRYDHLAYGFLRGVPYSVMEARTGAMNKPDLGRAREAAMRFSGAGASGFTPEQMEAWKAWESEAKAHLEKVVEKAPRVKVERLAWTAEQIEEARLLAR